MKRSYFLLGFLVFLVVSCSAEQPVVPDPTPTPDPPQTDKSFLETTTYGFYSSTDQAKAAAIVKYEEGVHQVSSITETSASVFLLTDMLHNYLFKTAINSKNLELGENVEVQAETNDGKISKSFSGEVVKKEGTTSWIENKTEHIGCIVATE